LRLARAAELIDGPETLAAGFAVDDLEGLIEAEHPDAN
jgi:hypothetical protein